MWTPLGGGGGRAKGSPIPKFSNLRLLNPQSLFLAVQYRQCSSWQLSELLMIYFAIFFIQPGAMKLVLWCHLMHVQWIPFLMFESLNSCGRKRVCAKIMPNVGKNLSWCALLPNFKKNQERKFVSSQIRLVHFPHLRGQLWGVTTSQHHSFLSIVWHFGLRRWGTIAYC